MAARHGAVNGLMTAGALIADPGNEFVPVDGVGALAVTASTPPWPPSWSTRETAG